MSGMIVGGWEFVYAAYAVTGAALTIYALSVIARYRRERRTLAGEQE
jgi:hypothetical protein